MRPTKFGSRHVSPQSWLLATVVLTLGPHASQLPIWLALLCGGLLIGRAWQLYRSVPKKVSKWLILLVAAGTAAGVKLHFGHFFGKDPGIALLAVLLCLKQFEVAADRDIRSGVLLSFFLQLSLFLYDQTLLIAGFALSGTLIAMTTLLSLQDTRADLRGQLRGSALLLAQSIPFLLVLFVAFPRIPGPLWGLPTDAYSGTTGLSERMEPGSISNLGQSSAIALRAKFVGPPPAPQQRYWRGPVLSLFDGRVWRPLPASRSRTPPYSTSGPAFDYVLTLEPHNRQWMLALDFPSTTGEQFRYTNDFQLLSATPIRSRLRTAMRAFPEAVVGEYESEATLRANLNIPRSFNPRTLALVDNIVATTDTAEARIANIISHFRSAGLTYTLQPPLLDRDSVDSFLFDTQRGFCEHFASAFVFMVRAAGIPARVVTGYLGGEINPVDQTLIVRQSDAHAWAEVWLEGRGWQRVDPTAEANPARLDEGMAGALPDDEALPMLMRPAFSWLRDLRYRWEATTNLWNEWVIGFNTDRQKQFFEDFGLTSADWKSLTGIMGAGIGALMLLLFGWAFVRQRVSDPVDREWQRLCTRLARYGIARLPWEGPLDYAKRASSTIPEHATQLKRISETYARLTYGPTSRHRATLRSKFSREIRELNLK